MQIDLLLRRRIGELQNPKGFQKVCLLSFLLVMALLLPVSPSLLLPHYEERRQSLKH